MGSNNQKAKGKQDVPSESNEIINIDDYIESLPKEQRDIAAKVVRVVKARVFQGPIPPPEILKEYENILPGAAREIFDLTNNQQKHRINMEQIIISQENRRESLGQWFAFILGGMCIICSLIAAYMGATTLACILASPTLLGVIGVFVIRQFPGFINKGAKSIEDIEQ